MLARTSAALALTILAAAFGPRTLAASLDAYAYGIDVQSACATSGPTPNITATGLNLLAIPFQSPPCTAGQLLKVKTSSSKPANVVSIIAGAGDSSFGHWTESGSSRGLAGFGALTARAQSTLTGHGDGATRVGHESFARFADTLTIKNGAGAGLAHLVITITGIATASARGTGEISLNVWENTNPNATEATRLTLSNGAWTLRNDGAYQSLVAPLPAGVVKLKRGFRLTALTAHLDLPFSYGVPSNLRALLYTSAAAGYGDTASILDFTANATLSSIRVDGNPAPVIVTGSGAIYPIIP